jgi:hypothetical protein
MLMSWALSTTPAFSSGISVSFEKGIIKPLAVFQMVAMEGLASPRSI